MPISQENKLFLQFVSADGLTASDFYRVGKITTASVDPSSGLNAYYNMQIDGVFGNDILFIGSTAANMNEHKVRFVNML